MARVWVFMHPGFKIMYKPCFLINLAVSCDNAHNVLGDLHLEPCVIACVLAEFRTALPDIVCLDATCYKHQLASPTLGANSRNVTPVPIDLCGCGTTILGLLLSSPHRISTNVKNVWT